MRDFLHLVLTLCHDQSIGHQHEVVVGSGRGGFKGHLSESWWARGVTRSPRPPPKVRSKPVTTAACP